MFNVVENYDLGFSAAGDYNIFSTSDLIFHHALTMLKSITLVFFLSLKHACLLLPQGLCIYSCFCLEYFSLRLSNVCLFLIVLIRFIPLVPSISCTEVTLYVCSFISCIDCFLPLECYLETEPWSVYPLLLYPHTTLSQVLEKKKSGKK